MINVTASSGSEVQGLQIEDALVNRIWPGASDAQLAQQIPLFLRQVLALKIAFSEGVSFTDAVEDVEETTTIQT